MLSGRHVAVIVAAYNAEQTISSCLESLMSMETDDLDVEVVVVDNGSTDGSREVISRDFRRVRLLFESRRGPAAARNHGIRETSAEWIAFTDADCVVDKDWIAGLVTPLVETDVGISGGRIKSVQPCNRIARFGDLIHDHRAAIEERDRPYAITMNWASRREVLFRAGLFDETLMRGSDADMAFRLGKLGYRIVYRPAAVVYHRNETTFAGLFREGRMHASGATAIRAKEGGGASRRAPSVKLLLRDLRQLVTGRDNSRFEALCSTAFNAGKVVGELGAPRR